MMKNVTKMLAGLKSKLLSFVLNSLCTELKIVQKSLCGLTVKTVKGTLKGKADQDDAWFFHLAGHHKRIYDIGANIGYTALLTNIQGNAEKLLLIDPNPEALSIAAKNLILNNLAENATFYTSFVSDKSGEQVPFYTVAAGSAGSMFKGHAETAAAINSFYMVTTISIDDLVKKLGWSPDLIKIDVEGAESLVLLGAIQLAANRATTFIVEMHSPPELPMTENAQRVLEWCKSSRYRAWYMRDACPLQSSEQVADRGRCHLLLLPEHQKYPDYLREIKQGAALPASI